MSRRNEPILVDYKGKKVSLYRLSKILGIAYTTIHSRHKRGFKLDISAAVQPPMPVGDKHLYDNRMLTIKEISKETGMSQSTLYYKLRKGLPPFGNATLGSSSKINDEGRECSRCKEFKTWDCFYNNKIGPRGKNSHCIMCGGQ